MTINTCRADRHALFLYYVAAANLFPPRGFLHLSVPTGHDHSPVALAAWGRSPYGFSFPHLQAYMVCNKNLSML